MDTLELLKDTLKDLVENTHTAIELKRGGNIPAHNLIMHKVKKRLAVVKRTLSNLEKAG